MAASENPKSFAPGVGDGLDVHTDCRHFSGYRPCHMGRPCGGCPAYDPVLNDVLIINLDGLGDVLRTTALLPVIRREVPGSRITWLTSPRACELLQGHPDLDEVVPLRFESLLALEARVFDLLLSVDKGGVGGGLAMRIRARERRGFGVDEHGAIVPLGPAALPLYRLGLDDHLKFRVNQRTEPHLLAEALGFTYRRDPYRLYLQEDERVGPPRRVGFNTGCSPLYPLKRLPLGVQEAAIRLLAPHLEEPVLLLGGPEDRARNRELARRLGPMVEETPTDAGLRVGAAHVGRCQVVVTGDSLGMHLAIALQRHVVVWFGLTCPQEIDVYQRGVKVLADVDCAPCWRRQCENTPLCRERVAPEWIRDAVLDSLRAHHAGEAIDEVRGGGWWRPAG